MTESPFVFSSAEWTSIAGYLENTGRKLTRRELQVCRLLFEDLPERGIAERLGISTHTVNDHLRTLKGKLGVSTRLSIVLQVFLAFRQAKRLASSLNQTCVEQ